LRSLRKRRHQRGNHKRARLRRRAVAAPHEGKTLESEAWTCQRDEISLRSATGSKPPRGCENLRAEGGDGLEPIVTANPRHPWREEAKEASWKELRVGRRAAGWFRHTL
jgi:hypothetical protein